MAVGLRFLGAEGTRLMREVLARPDISPHALTAARNLQIYDEAYARLRTEYLAVSLGRKVRRGRG